MFGAPAAAGAADDVGRTSAMPLVAGFKDSPRAGRAPAPIARATPTSARTTALANRGRSKMPSAISPSAGRSIDSALARHPESAVAQYVERITGITPTEMIGSLRISPTHGTQGPWMSEAFGTRVGSDTGKP